MKYCENCGERVYALGCVNCDEIKYIEAQDEYEPPEPDCYQCGPKEIAQGRCKCQPSPIADPNGKR